MTPYIKLDRGKNHSQIIQTSRPAADLHIRIWLKMMCLHHLLEDSITTIDFASGRVELNTSEARLFSGIKLCPEMTRYSLALVQRSLSD